MKRQFNPHYPSTHDHEGRKQRIDHHFGRIPIEKSHSNEKLSDAYNEGYHGAIEEETNPTQFKHSMRTPSDYNSSRKKFRNKSYKRSDEKIKEDVCMVLEITPNVNAGHIQVTVDHGCLFLRGTVNSRIEKIMAEAVVEDVTGVEFVRNELIIGK